TPVCLIEALACGRRVVSTNVGGVADVLQGGALGRLVERGDLEGLTEALSAAIDDATPIDPRVAVETRARYDIRRLADDLGTLYDSVTQSLTLTTTNSGESRPRLTIAP